MVGESLDLARYVASGWSLTTEFARGQPLGATVLLLLLADLALSGLGALADRWEGIEARRTKPPRRSSRTAPKHPACGAEPAPSP